MQRNSRDSQNGWLVAHRLAPKPPCEPRWHEEGHACSRCAPQLQAALHHCTGAHIMTPTRITASRTVSTARNTGGPPLAMLLDKHWLSLVGLLVRLAALVGRLHFAASCAKSITQRPLHADVQSSHTNSSQCMTFATQSPEPSALIETLSFIPQKCSSNVCFFHTSLSPTVHSCFIMIEQAIHHTAHVPATCTPDKTIKPARKGVLDASKKMLLGAPQRPAQQTCSAGVH